MFGRTDRQPVGETEGGGEWRAGATILRIIAAARLEDAPAAAAAFGVLHAYAENRCPELNERIDALAGCGGRLTAALCDELHRRYVVADDAGTPRGAVGRGPPPPPVLRAEVRRLESRLAAAEEELGRDHLTGLASRRRMEAELAALARACRAGGRALSVAVVDVDRFKAINDGHGHATGDDVLRLVAAVLSSRSDAVRLVARLGGDEFVLVLPDAALDRATAVVEGLRRRLAHRRFVARATGWVIGSVSISAGLAELRPGEAAADLLSRADAALYAAKRSGRDAVAAAIASSSGAPDDAAACRRLRG